MRSTFIIVAAAGILFSAVAFAEDAAAPPAQTAQSVDPDKMVCKTMAPTTGTRLGNRRVCQTEHQWEQMQQDNQKLTSDIQMRDRATSLGN